MEIIKIVIFEDNIHLREGLTQLINGTQGFKCVGAFSDVSDVLHNIRVTQPTVILMDIGLPSKMDGIEATFLIKENFPEIFVIIQTVFDSHDRVFEAIKSGASGYLLKNTPPVKLLEAIQDVVLGGAPMSPSIAFKVLEMFKKGDTKLPDSKREKSQLTERQQEILEGIVQGKSYKIIAQELFITVDTIKFHVRKIYDILKVGSRFELMAMYGK